MIYQRTGEPAGLPVALDDFKRHTRREPGDTGEDMILDTYLQAAVGHLDGAGGVLHRCLITQEWQAFADAPVSLADQLGRSVYGTSGFRIDLGPVDTDADIGVSYRAGGVWVAIDPATVAVLPDRSGRVLLSRPSWPAADRVPRAWRITFTAGTAADDVPAAIKAAVMLLAADLDGNRDGKTLASLVANPTVDLLLAPYRLVSV